MALRRKLRAAARHVGAPLPPKTMRAIVAALSPGTRANTGLPTAREIVVVAPHPDDESIGCGGLIALAARSGARVTVLFVTDGENLLIADRPGSLAQRRRAQGTAACTVLGAEPVFLGFADGNIDGGDLDALGSVLTDALTAAGLVLLPWFGDANADHRAVNAALARASLRADLTVWGYEVWSPLPANRILDITSVADDKRRAVAAHTADVFIDVDAPLGLNRFRAGVSRLDGTYAEAFFEAPADEYKRLVLDALGP
jgi:LmbE family N-acetylglucosaminyl deacetylase